tara:strand:- start:542 stop:730 length:189 start_codon:yes stop_codon:yes gene_type:complete
MFNNLMKFRMEQGLTQRELASKADVHSSMISHLERGTREGTITVWRKLALSLGVKLSELIPD